MKPQVTILPAAVLMPLLPDLSCTRSARLGAQDCPAYHLHSTTVHSNSVTTTMAKTPQLLLWFACLFASKPALHTRMGRSSSPILAPWLLGKSSEDSSISFWHMGHQAHVHLAHPFSPGVRSVFECACATREVTYPGCFCWSRLRIRALSLWCSQGLS